MEDYREIVRRRAFQRRKKRKIQIISRVGIGVVVLLTIIGVIVAVNKKNSSKETSVALEEVLNYKYIDQRPELDVQLLDVNDYSRPGIALEVVNGIVIHYTANPGTTAQQNRNYFNGLAESKKTYASSHFIIGLSGEIIQCVPCNEIAYASNERNSDTISIECCIEDESGKFNEETYNSLIELTTWLMGRYSLTEDDVIRHYDVTGKNCPKYFVEHESEWENFKEDLLKYIDKYGVGKNLEMLVK